MLRKFFFYTFLFFTGSSFSQSHLKEIKNFGENPGKLSLYSFNASDRSFTKNKPLVMALHGCAMTAQKLNKLTEWDSLAKKNDFVVFYPQQKIINNGSNCFNWFLEKDINRNGESFSLYQMIRYAIDSLQIDSTRIFFYGVSAGACMSDVMCANYPWLIKKAAIYAGIPFKTATGAAGLKLAGKAIIKPANERIYNVKKQTPFYSGNFPEIIILHGTEDFVTDYAYAGEFVKQWTGVHEISDKATVTDTAFNNNNRVQRFSYQDHENEKVIYYKIIGLGHKIAVDEGNGEGKGGKDKFFSENVGFFSTYFIARDFGLILKDGK
jgi:poly(hydroxyalkanoate) depolymerase family esterase